MSESHIERLEKAQSLLSAFRSLINNPAWAEVAKRLDEAVEAAEQGGFAIGKTPEQRSEWVQAWHLANELRTMPATRMESLQTTIGECSAALAG